MKYVNKLTEEELRELYLVFADEGAKIKTLNIIRDEYGVGLEGTVEIPEYEEEILNEDPNATLVIDDDYELDDFNVRVFHHSGDVTMDYRKWMYKKFGNEYAKDYLLNYESEE